MARVIDRHDDNYSAAIDNLRLLVDEPEATPSSRILRELEDTGSSFFEFARGRAQCHRDYFASIAPLGSAPAAALAEEAAASLRRQQDIEEADSISLDEYLEQYFRRC